MQENLQLGCEEECDKIGTKTSEKKLDGEMHLLLCRYNVWWMHSDWPDAQHPTPISNNSCLLHDTFDIDKMLSTSWLISFYPWKTFKFSSFQVNKLLSQVWLLQLENTKSEESIFSSTNELQKPWLLLDHLLHHKILQHISQLSLSLSLQLASCVFYI